MILNTIKYLITRRRFETREEFNNRIKFKKLIKKNNIIEIKHFHPNGEKFPETGSYFQKGGFMGDCVKNRKSFDTNVEKGGIVVFASTVNVTYEMVDKKVTEFNNQNKFGECISAFSVGNFFKGRYVDDDGNVYNPQSRSIEINGISSEALIEFVGATLAVALPSAVALPEIVLVKDLNLDKIYLVKIVCS